jgi:hypothetical protein
MSKIFVTNIVGTGAYNNPSSDAVLAQVTAGMDSLLGTTPGVPLLAFDTVQAFVRDCRNADGSEGERTLNCIIDGFRYGGDPCPPEASLDQLLGAIETALKTNPGGELIGLITGVGAQRAVCWGVAPS